MPVCWKDLKSIDCFVDSYFLYRYYITVMNITTQQGYRPEGRLPSVKWLYPMVLTSAMVLYISTAQRGVPWQDSGMHQFRAIKFDLVGHLGLALSHPLYIAAGHGIWLISKEHFPFLMNAFSGLGMAIAMANLAAVCTILTGRRWIGAVSAAMLAVAHTPWWLGTISEVYAWVIAGLTAEIWLMILLIHKPTAGKLCALTFISGIGLSLHNFALLPLPIYIVVALVLVARKQLHAKALIPAAVVYLIGAGLYIGMIINQAINTGDIVGTIHSALFGKYASAVLNISSVSKYGKANAAISSMNFVNFLLPFAVIGWARLSQQAGRFIAFAIGAITVIELFFFIRYPVPDQFMFILPSLVMITIAASVGISRLAAHSADRARLVLAACIISIIIPPMVYATVPTILRNLGVNVRRKRPLPFRDEVRYWLTPWKHNENSAELFAKAVLTTVEPNGVIIAGPSSYYPIALFQKIHSIRKDVLLLGGNEPWGEVPKPSNEDLQAFFHALAGRPIYSVSNVRGYCPKALLPYIEERLHGIIYRIRPPAEQPPTSSPVSNPSRARR